MYIGILKGVVVSFNITEGCMNLKMGNLTFW